MLHGTVEHNRAIAKVVVQTFVEQHMCPDNEKERHILEMQLLMGVLELEEQRQKSMRRMPYWQFRARRRA